MSKTCLLVIDDEKSILDLLEITLAPYVDEIVLCQSGFEAIEIIKTQKIHTVLCDIVLVDTNGIEVIRKARLGGVNIPFIFLTGFSSAEYVLEAARYGAFDFIEKSELQGIINPVIEALKIGVASIENNVKFEGARYGHFEELLDKLSSKKNS